MTLLAAREAMSSRVIVAGGGGVLDIRRLLLLLCCWLQIDTFLPIRELIKSTATACVNAEIAEHRDVVDRESRRILPLPRFLLLEKMDSCRSGSARICDPDNVLASKEFARIEHTFYDSSGDQSTASQNDSVSGMTIRCGDQMIEVQVAVAIVSKVRVYEIPCSITM
jgi:hypothetical protein